MAPAYSDQAPTGPAQRRVHRRATPHPLPQRCQRRRSRTFRPLAAPSPTPGITTAEAERCVLQHLAFSGAQLIFNGTTFNQIRGTFFQRDSAYFAFRNTLDQLIATVKTQFYQIVVNRELVKVNEQSVQLLERSVEGPAEPLRSGNSSALQRAASGGGALQSASATDYRAEQLTNIEVAIWPRHSVSTSSHDAVKIRPWKR